MTQSALQLAGVFMTLIGSCAISSAQAGSPCELRVVSSRPETVSGGDVLAELTIAVDSDCHVLLNGSDVTASFRPAAGPSRRLGLLHGLNEGQNLLAVRVQGAIRSKLRIVNHPSTGPIFSGPHQQPFICQTDFNGLGSAKDADCFAETVVQYYYKPSQPPATDLGDGSIKALRILVGEIPPDIPAGFKVYDPASPPDDVALTRTPDGRSLPYIVRREIGVINRSTYDIRFLHRPDDPPPTPWDVRGVGNVSAWNGRLVFELSGGCAAGYRQGKLLAIGSNESLIAEGYAVAASTLNISGNNCNAVLSAETLSMVKEHFIKTYGIPVHTIGWGDSGGAVQQHLIAQNYPGLLDGIIPYISFPDTVTYVPSTSDCALLVRAFGNAKLAWRDEQKTAVTGFATWRTCSPNGFAVAPRNCDKAVPRNMIYDPVGRPRGVRCDVYDNEIAVFGRDSRTGFAARPLDNVGVEYGLRAFNEGKISAEQFVELNEQVGGFDVDGNIVSQRTQADAEAVRRAYQYGLVASGGGGLGELPIIDWRWYSDDQGDNHDSFRSFVTRARLMAANGTAANQVILIDPPASTFAMITSRLADPNPETSAFARRERELVGWMDRWLDNIATDHNPGALAEKVRRDKPSDVVDTCWAVDGERVSGSGIYDTDGRCSQLYPRHADPRIAAGAPLTDDILKCELQRLDAAQYAQTVSADQLARLKAVFPSGVCDYNKPGVGQQVVRTTWREY